MVATTTRLLLAMLDGCRFANATMPWGSPGPMELPGDARARTALVEAHIAAAPFDVVYVPADKPAQRLRLRATSLAALCPDADGNARWLGLDLDGEDHGASGLADPGHAVRCIAEAADRAGLFSGLVVARSRRGRGRHMFVVLPGPTPLHDAVFGVAALISAAYVIAAADVAEHGTPHAFRRADGRLAQPGDSGAVELIPRSSLRPRHGWPLTLPAGGAFAASGGGVIVDPFDNSPHSLSEVPRCDHRHWVRFIADVRAHRARRRLLSNHRPLVTSPASSPRRISDQTRAFLAGEVKEGMRNIACFAAACNLIGTGVSETEAEQLILTGAAKCGLGEREARVAFASAIGTLRRRRRP